MIEENRPIEDADPYRCKQCGNRSTSFKSMRKHNKTHLPAQGKGPKPTIGCDFVLGQKVDGSPRICPATFPTLRSLKAHWNREHAIKAEEIRGEQSTLINRN